MPKSKKPRLENLAPRLGDGYDQPLVIDDVLYAFPGHLDKLLPEWDAIPEEFKGHPKTNMWVDFTRKWFCGGWPEDMRIYTRPDVEGEDAFRHAHTIMKSFEPKHEHKIAGVAWLLSRWFADVAIEPVLLSEAEGASSR